MITVALVLAFSITTTLASTYQDTGYLSDASLTEISRQKADISSHFLINTNDCRQAKFNLAMWQLTESACYQNFMTYLKTLPEDLILDSEEELRNDLYIGELFMTFNPEYKITDYEDALIAQLKTLVVEMKKDGRSLRLITLKNVAVTLDAGQVRDNAIDIHHMLNAVNIYDAARVARLSKSKFPLRHRYLDDIVKHRSLDDFRDYFIFTPLAKKIFKAFEIPGNEIAFFDW